MKKTLAFFLAFLCFAISTSAKRIQLNLRTEHVSVNNVSQYLDSLCPIPDVKYILFRDAEEMNVRHMAFHQLYKDVLVENCDIYVHSKGGFITSISGDILDINIDKKKYITKSAARRKAKVDKSAKLEETIIYHNDSFIRVYKITKINEIVYIDVKTNEIIETRPLIISSTTNCSISTKYTKTTAQKINCDYSNNKYFLENSDKGIFTYTADMTDRFAGTGNLSNITSYSGQSTNWDNTYLTSITITSCSNKWWEGVLETDDYPDLYIAIENANGDVLYFSDYKPNVQTSPATFYISDMIKVPTGGGYKIKVYDKDTGGVLDGDDDLGITVTITSNTLGTHSWGTVGSSNVVGQFEITKWNPALDVQWGLEKVYNFYKNVLGLNSFDDANSPIKAYLHSVSRSSNISQEKTIFDNENKQNNAFATGDPADASTAFLYFGLGNQYLNSEVGYNTICHEFTHLVTQYRPLGDLYYHGESGAINEGYSDAMAMTAEYALLGKTDWKYDKECLSGSLFGNYYDCVRDLAHPEAGGVEGVIKPSTYGDENWIDPDGDVDNGGVHVNNSIFTYWYYLLCEGGSGTNNKGYKYNINSLGVAKGLEIIWNLHRNYIDPKCTFSQLRFNSLEFAMDAYGVDSKEYKSIEAAWNAVGVYTSSPILDGQYLIFAETDSCAWFMSSTLTTTSTKRYTADTLASLKDYYYLNPDPSYVWDVTRNSNGTYYIQGKNGYMSWNSGNSGAISSTPKELIISAADDYLYSINFMSSATETRYLSLNNNYPYFAFYGNQGQNYKLYFLEAYFADTLTIKAQIPSDWKNTIRAWVWYDGEEGQWVNVQKEDMWYVYRGLAYEDAPKFNIIFVNGTTWSTNSNQTVDISVSEDMCIRISDDKTNKRSYTNIDCYGTSDLESTPKETPSDRFTKIIKNGQLYILRDGKTYNAQGGEL